MIDFLSIHITDFLCKKQVIKEEKKEIYVYGYQLLISSFIGIILTITLGIIFHKLWLTLLYLVIFISTRQHCGGYHANHFVSCILSFLFTYIVVIAFESYLIKSDYLLYSILMEIIYFMTVLRFAPIEHVNKPLSEEVKRNNRKKSVIYSIVWILISIPAYFLLPELAIMISLTLATIAMFMLFEIVQRR